MAETDSPEINCVYVDTSLDTHFGVLVHNHVTISDFKEKLCREHQQCFPKTGEIDITAVKVKRENPLGVLLDYHLPDSMCLSKAFDGVSNDSWFVFVDASVRVVEKNDLPIIMDSEDNRRLNHELVEKSKEIATDSLLLDGYTKNLTLGEDFETEMVEKTATKKRKLKSSDGEKSGKKHSVKSSDRERSRKKRSVDPNQSAAVDADVRVVEKSDLPEHELVEKSKEIATGSLLLEGYTKNPTLDEDFETEVVEKTATKKRKLKSSDEERSRKKHSVKSSDGERSRKKRSVDPNQSADVTTSRFDVGESHELRGNVQVEVAAAAESSLREKLDETLTEPTGKENVGRDKIETDELVSHTENHLDTNSGLTARPDTEKKIKRKKRSKDDINESSAAVITTSRDIVNEINGIPANVHPVDATPESLPNARRENLDNLGTEASQKGIEMGEKSVDDVDTNSGFTTRLDTEKKQKRKKRSKDDIEESSAAAITTSRDIVNEIAGVPANVDRVDATLKSLPIASCFPFAESSQKKNEMVEKSTEDVGRDNNESISQLDGNSGLASRSDTEEKRRKKSSKVDINQSFAATATSGDIVNEINGVPANADLVDATYPGVPSAEARQKETETGEKIDDAVGGGKAIPSAADNIQPSNVEIDADEAKFVKPTKKIKSKKAKTPAKEDTLVASGAQNVEPVEVVDGEGTDTVIRNVLDSLQEKNETEEALEKTGKKSSKKSKKKPSSKVAESQVLSVEVNNAALQETPLINNRKDTDALFTPAKKDTESDASVLKKISEVPDNAEDYCLKNIVIEKADMGDNFGCSQKDDDIVGGGKKKDQVTGGAKSKKVKKRLDLHPSGSIDGSLSSMKPKAKKSRAQQPASSGTSLLQSMVKNDRSRSVKAAVNSKKQDVKTSAKPVTVMKRKTNFFEGADNDSSEDEHNNKTSGVSTKTPSDYSSDDDSDVTSMSRKQGNKLDGGTIKFSGSLQDMVRGTSSFKNAMIRAQSQPDILDDVDIVPDSQAV